MELALKRQKKKAASDKTLAAFQLRRKASYWPYDSNTRKNCS